MKLTELSLDRQLYKDTSQNLETKDSAFVAADSTMAEPESIPAGGAAQDINTGNVTINGAQLTPGTYPQTVLDVSNWGWGQTCAFSSTDADTVSWGAGTFKSADGTSYSISAGNTGNMSAKTYIYLDLLTSETAYQVTTTPATAVGIGKVLIAVAQNDTATNLNATYNLSEATQIVGDNILANSINASKITTGQLISAIITLAVNDGVGDSMIHAGKTDFVATKLLGDSTTRFNITHISGTTFRYTYASGTNPNIGAYVFVGSTISVYLLDGTASAGNSGVFVVSAVSTNYFEVTNPYGVEESGDDIGDGKVEVGHPGFILGIDDSDSNKSKFTIGDYNRYLEWNGSTLNLKGSLSTIDFRWNTVFEAIDGYLIGGSTGYGTIVGQTGLLLRTGAVTNDTATISKRFDTVPYFMTWEKKRTLRCILGFSNTTNLEGYITWGSLTGNNRKIGFYFLADQIKGIVSDGSSTTSIFLLNPFTANTDYVLDAKFFPGSRCEFYVNGVFVGMIITTLPAGDSGADVLIDGVINTYTNATRTANLQLWEIWQEY